jgi:hypothetical protein
MRKYAIGGGLETNSMSWNCAKSAEAELGSFARGDFILFSMTAEFSR